MAFVRIVHFLEKIIYPVVRGAHKVGLGIILVTMFMTVVDVTGRKFFSAPITGSYELTELMLALIVFFALGYTQIQKGHIVMEALVSRLQPRTQFIIESIIYFISTWLALLMTWQLAAHAKRLWLAKNVTGVLHLPIHPFLIAASFGSLLFTLTLFVDFLKYLQKARER